MIYLNTTPNNWQNVYNEMVFNVSSTNASAAGFQFLVDINVNGQNNPVARLTYPKQPNVDTVDIDVSEVLRQYVSYDFQSYNSSGIKHCTSSKVDYWIEFGEVRNNASGVPTIYPNLANFGLSDDNKHSSNAIFDFLTWSIEKYSQDYDVSFFGFILNQNILVEKIRYGEERFLTIFDPNQVFDRVRFQVLDKNYNVLIQSVASFTNYPSIVSVNVGKSGNFTGYYKTVYDFAFTDPNAYYIYIIGQNTEGDYDVFSRIFQIDKSCQKYEPVRLHWLNNLGGFDAFTFTKVSRNFTDIERKMFKKFQPLNYQKTFRAKTNYFTKYSDTIQINSDGLTDIEWTLLKELILSPVVMMEIPTPLTSTSMYVPVNIKESNYEEKKYINDRQISSLQLTLEYTFDNYRQSL